ncbi:MULTISPECIES: TetR/AcrR family transcriptional regulator [unclassified Erythrobacter]|uniref:TetR/AcrR family transcriptional regulator n=1 Tax=Erythrobacteraceae TaxID=335929 RepID=UPI00076DAD41|nr:MULTISPECIES: TetR/AcrR family transcriptional regulator [unclassified Erythrobacter]KWV94131.1 transcriptional regulator [Erythrobacter sp. AP23]MBO6769505.1 TetR/AcrR family transcriptional regulator [Erythrobacter sp.]
MSSIEPKRTGRPADEAKREAILAAAADCFFEHGFAASSIEQIAADAGVSKVTIYNRFGDKRALFTAAVELECEQLRDSLKVPDIPSGSLRHRLTAIGEAMVAFLSRPRMVQFERRIAADTEHEPAVGEAFLTAGPLRMKKAFAALIAAMHDAGEIEVGDPELAAEQFASMCKGMGDLERRFGAADDPDRNRRRIEGAVEVFCRAYARD